MALYIGFLDETHEGSSSPVVHLKGARLERSLES